MRSRSRSVFAALFAFGTAGAALAACGPGFLDGLTGGTRDGGRRNTFDAGESCVGAIPPEPPDTPDTPGDLKLTFAFRALRVNRGGPADAGANAPLGLNLDRTCTCPAPEPCIPFDSGKNDRGVICDDELGRDIASATLFDRASIATEEFREDFGTKRIENGYFTVIIDLFGWNGQPNDRLVAVRMMMSQGLDETLSVKSLPTFDGSDIWTVDPDSIRDGAERIEADCRRGALCEPRIFDIRAYVRDGVLVANLEDPETKRAPIVVRAAAGRLVFDLAQARLVAKIIKTDAAGPYRLEGEITGRWPVESLLRTLANVDDPVNKGHPLCETPFGVYNGVKSLVCELADVPAQPDLDRIGESCGAISSALSFIAVPAAAGRVINRDNSKTTCADWKDDCTKP
jgi:hypothetical protein